jgi:hypothetical protein
LATKPSLATEYQGLREGEVDQPTPMMDEIALKFALSVQDHAREGQARTL